MKQIVSLLIMLAFCNSSFGAAIAQWKMNDDAATAVVVDSVGSYTGTFVDENTPATITSDHSVAGHINEALDFDGTNDYITVADSNNFTFVDVPFSVAAWISLGANGASEFEILSKFETTEMEWAFYISGDALYFVLWDDSLGGNSGRKDTSDYSLYEESGGYLFVVGTYDGSGDGTGIKIYLDGDQVDNAAETNGTFSAMENTASSLRIGMRHASPNKAIGQIDNVVVFNTELTQAQITGLYNEGAGTESVSLSSYAGSDRRSRWSQGYRYQYRSRYKFE